MRRHGSLSTPRLILGHEKFQGQEVPRWREISTGVTTGLHSWDYTANDWEVMSNNVSKAHETAGLSWGQGDKLRNSSGGRKYRD